MQPETRVPDYVLAEYVFLQREIKQMETRLQDMKVRLKSMGSFSTENYMCVISEQVQQRVKPLEELIALVGTEVLKELNLINVRKFEIIRVVKKINDLS